MKSFATIRRLLSAPGPLASQMVTISPPATTAQLSALESVLFRPLSTQQRDLLRQWNGLNLDVVRLAGAPPVLRSIPSILDLQTLRPACSDGWVGIGCDPAGFVYFEDDNRAIHCLDTDGGEVSLVASSLDSFIADYVFGERAAEFAGDDWLSKLAQYGFRQNA